MFAAQSPRGGADFDLKWLDQLKGQHHVMALALVQERGFTYMKP